MIRWTTTLMMTGLLVGPAGVPPRAQIPIAMVGAWNGPANVYSNWTELQTIDVTLFIAPDGTASGAVGGALLRDARLGRHRSVFGRMFGYGPDWALNGALEGQVVPSAGPPRARIVMSLNWERDHFEGGFVVTTTSIRGHREIVETAGRMRLTRLSAPGDDPSDR